MKVATFDIETNGLLMEVDRVHCAAVKDHSTGAIKTFTPDSINGLIHYLDTFNCLIGHNCVQYDFPVLRKIFGWNYEGQIIDTLLMSRLQSPNRLSPQGYIGKAPHSVAAWGYRLNDYKREHEDWTVYSEEMLERCTQDVKLQYKIYQALIYEGEDVDSAIDNVKLEEQYERDYTTEEENHL